MIFLTCVTVGMPPDYIWNQKLSHQQPINTYLEMLPDFVRTEENHIGTSVVAIFNYCNNRIHWTTWHCRCQCKSIRTENTTRKSSYQQCSRTTWWFDWFSSGQWQPGLEGNWANHWRWWLIPWRRRWRGLRWSSTGRAMLRYCRGMQDQFVGGYEHSPIAGRKLREQSEKKPIRLGYYKECTPLNG